VAATVTLIGNAADKEDAGSQRGGRVACWRGSGQHGGESRGWDMRADWKSADEIEADIKTGECTSITELVVDLWRRVDELQQRVAELQNKLAEE
jgi:hypothetical protein